MENNTVGKNIRHLRARMGLSQEQFGILIGKGGSSVGDYENGRVDVTVGTLFKIAEACKVPPEEVLTGKKEQPKKGWDAELRIYGAEDRKQVMMILAVNGYDVGQHKEKASPTGKSVNYFVHATDRKENADTSK